MTTYTQTKIAQSRWTLTATSVYAVLVCLATGPIAQQLWIQMLLLGLSTLLMAEFNNVNSLIRIYSHMVSCSLLVMTTMSSFLFSAIEPFAVQAALIAFFFCLFKAYQKPTATGWILYAFFAFGIASIAFVQMLFFVPILWILMANNVMAFSARTFFASILGVIAPYWFLAPYYIYIGNADFFARHFTNLVQIDSVFNLSLLDEHRIITIIFIFLLALIGSLHFIYYSYQDKIRTRMIYETFIALDCCCFALMVVLPQYFNQFLGVAIVTTAPLIGHYLALSHTKISNICFFAVIALALIITVYNLWMPLTIFS
ncbi:MAG: hypothetical protein ACOYJK_06405 [Prevotella sp.]|jgi:hypothetical protein